MLQLMNNSKSLSYFVSTLLKDTIIAGISLVSDPFHRASFYRGHAGASRAFPNDTTWETLNQRLHHSG